MNCNALMEMETKDAVGYYVYLSLLMDSSHMARKDEMLVKEWCIMSISTEFKSENNARRENFMKVALIEDTTQSPYHRDLSYLLDASITIKDVSLTLELSGEIIARAKKESECELLTKTVRHLMTIAMNCINEGQEMNFDRALVKEVLALFNRLETSKHKVCRESIVVSEELLKLLAASTATNHSSEEDLATLMADISSPRSYLKAMSAWTPSEQVSMSSMVSILKRCLIRGLEVNNEGSDEISFALLRIREIRQKVTEDPSKAEVQDVVNSGLSIWEQMEQGNAIINK